MSTEYITLTRKDPTFESHLLGTFSKDHVALPVESFGVGSPKERVTFHLVEINKILRPSWIYIYYRAIRPELLGLTLGHSMVAVLSLLALFAQHNISISLPFLPFALSLILSLLGVVLAHASGCLFNDFRDHMKGVDRKSVSKGSQVIQQGWCRAVVVRRWALVNAVLAASIGIYLFWGQWILFSALFCLSALSILLHSWMIPFWNRLGAGDFWISFLFGPLLFFSVGWAVLSPLKISFYQYPIEVWRDFLILSWTLGLMASWTLQVRQLQGIFKMTSEGFRTLIARFNFDQAKKFLVVEGTLFGLLQVFVAWWLWPQSAAWLGLGLAVGFILYFNYRLLLLKSPLSSEMPVLGARALSIHGSLILIWVLSLWIL